MNALACGLFWEDQDHEDTEHICIKTPGHRGEHACWCGTKEAA